jgi:ankyrin repeat protein
MKVTPPQEHAVERASSSTPLQTTASYRQKEASSTMSSSSPGEASFLSSICSAIINFFKSIFDTLFSCCFPRSSSTAPPATEQPQPTPAPAAPTIPAAVPAVPPSPVFTTPSTALSTPLPSSPLPSPTTSPPSSPVREEPAELPEDSPAKPIQQRTELPMETPSALPTPAPQSAVSKEEATKQKLRTALDPQWLDLIEFQSKNFQQKVGEQLRADGIKIQQLSSKEIFLYQLLQSEGAEEGKIQIPNTDDYCVVEHWMIRHLFSQIPDLSKVSTRDPSLFLHYAKSEQTKAFLIEQCKDLLAQQLPRQGTILHQAVRSGDLAAVQTLLNSGADPTVVNTHGDSPFSLCTSIEMFQLFLQKNPTLITHRDERGNEILHFWQFNGHLTEEKNEEILAYLIQQGANVNAKNTHEQTALSLAIDNHRPKTMTLLLKHGASAEQIIKKQPLFHYFIERSFNFPQEKQEIFFKAFETIVQKLKAAGQLDILDPHNRTPLLLAVEETDEQISHTWQNTITLKWGARLVSYLIEQGADIDRRIYNKTPLLFFFTRLHWSRGNGWDGHAQPIFTQILAKTKQLNTPHEGKTALELALELGRSSSAIALIDGGANVDIKIKGAPLIHALIEDDTTDFDLLKKVVEKTPNIHTVVDTQNRTPFQHAIAKGKGYERIVLHLIEKGANVQCTIKNEPLPLILLVDRWKDHLFKAVIEAGYKTDTALLDSCLVCAANNNRFSLMGYLIDLGATPKFTTRAGDSCLKVLFDQVTSELSLTAFEKALAKNPEEIRNLDHNSGPLYVASKKQNLPSAVRARLYIALINAGSSVDVPMESGGFILSIFKNSESTFTPSERDSILEAIFKKHPEKIDMAVMGAGGKSLLAHSIETAFFSAPDAQSFNNATFVLNLGANPNILIADRQTRQMPLLHLFISKAMHYDSCKNFLLSTLIPNSRLDLEKATEDYTQQTPLAFALEQLEERFVKGKDKPSDKDLTLLAICDALIAKGASTKAQKASPNVGPNIETWLTGNKGPGHVEGRPHIVQHLPNFKPPAYQ